MLGANRHLVQMTPVNAPRAPRRFTFDASDVSSHLTVGVVQQDVSSQPAVGAVSPGLHAWQTAQPFGIDADSNLDDPSQIIPPFEWYYGEYSFPGVAFGVMPQFMGASANQPGVGFGGNAAAGTAAGAAQGALPAAVPVVGAAAANAQGPAAPDAVSAAGPAALPAILPPLAAGGPAGAPAQGAVAAAIPAGGAAAANAQSATTTADPAAPPEQHAAPAILPALGAAGTPAQGAVRAAIPAAANTQGIRAAGTTLAAGPAAPVAQDAIPATIFATAAPAGPAQDVAPPTITGFGAAAPAQNGTLAPLPTLGVAGFLPQDTAPSTITTHVVAASPDHYLAPATVPAYAYGPPAAPAHDAAPVAFLATACPPAFPTEDAASAIIISTTAPASPAHSKPRSLEVAAPNCVGVQRTIDKVAIPAITKPAVSHKASVHKKKNAAKLEGRDCDLATEVSGGQESAAARGGGRFAASIADVEKKTSAKPKRKYERDGDLATEVRGDQESAAARGGGLVVASVANAEKKTSAAKPKRKYERRTPLGSQNNAWKWNAAENAAFDMFYFPVMTIEGWNEDTLAMSRATGRNRQQVRSHKAKKFQKWRKHHVMASHVPLKGGTPPNPLVSIYTIKPEWAPEPDTEVEEPHVLSLEEFNARLQDYMVDGRVKWDRVRGITAREPEILQELAQEALTFGPHTFDESAETGTQCVRPGFERAFETMQAFFIEITDRVNELIEEGVISEERAVADFCIDLRQGGTHGTGANGGDTGADGGDSNGGGANGGGAAELDMDL